MMNGSLFFLFSMDDKMISQETFMLILFLNVFILNFSENISIAELRQ